MRQKLYDQYYRSLDLEPGASLEDIDRMWHLLVQVWHPDRLPPGTAVYQHAVKRMQDINVARDELRAYWQANGHAPPVGSTGGSAPPPRPQPSPASGATASPPPPADSPPPAPPPPGNGSPSSQAPPPPAGPAMPAFEKTWIHHIYDYMDRNATDSNPGLAVAFGFVLLVASFGLARVLLLPVWPMDHEYTNQDNMAILVIAFIIFMFLFRLMYASYEVYKLLEKPFFEAVHLSPDAALQRIVASLESTRYNDHAWTIQSTEGGDSATAGGARLVTATMQLAEAVVTLNAHIWPSQLAGWSVIGLEFDADHPWRIAAPYAPVRVTNEAIIASLNAAGL
ncbi:MAG: J domain-containing protein [Candidatus Obscuribacterales bacterium]